MYHSQALWVRMNSLGWAQIAYAGPAGTSNRKPGNEFMAGGEKVIQNWTKTLAFALVVLVVVFLSQVAVHTHETGQNETTCQICQAVHLGSILLCSVFSICVILEAAEYVAPFVLAFHQEFFFHDSPSRAPPSFAS